MTPRGLEARQQLEVAALLRRHSEERRAANVCTLCGKTVGLLDEDKVSREPQTFAPTHHVCPSPVDRLVLADIELPTPWLDKVADFPVIERDGSMTRFGEPE